MIDLAWEHGADSGRVVLKVDGRVSGELTYRRDGADVVVADHTFVEPALRGHGHARRLVDALVEWAREDELRIDPTCWYVRQVLEADPELSELIAA